MNSTALTGLLQQPRPFFALLCGTMGAIWLLRRSGILRFLRIKQLGFPMEQAFITFGAFAALVYGLISIGGYVGDHLLARNVRWFWARIVLAAGYFMTGLSLLKPNLIFIAGEYCGG